MRVNSFCLHLFQPRPRALSQRDGGAAIRAPVLRQSEFSQSETFFLIESLLSP